MKRKKKSRIRKFITFLLMVFIIAFACKSIIPLGDRHQFENEFDDKTTSYSSLTIDPDQTIESNPPVNISPDTLNSTNAILLRLKDQAILMEKDSEGKIYPASLTKMMTAIVAIEYLHDLEEEIELTNSTFQGLYEADASMAGFQPGEKVRAIDLLYGVMLPSGAESCIGLAEYIAGSEQDFVGLMNQKAVQLGMDKTHFENATGLHDDNHYTTAKDLAALLHYAIQDETFREIFTSSSHSTQATNKHPEGITFHSTLFTKLSNPKVFGGEILGGKTGYTEEGGLCLASLAVVSGKEYILISAGAKGDHFTEQYHITDACTVYSRIGN